MGGGREVLRSADVIFMSGARRHATSQEAFRLRPEHIAEGWKWEAEMKFPGVTRQKLEKLLASEAIQARIARGEFTVSGPIFDGVIKTWQFNDGFELAGASARVKEVRYKDGTKRYFWAIKVTPPVDATATLEGEAHVLLKNKLEYEHEAPSYNAAVRALNEAARQFGLVKKRGKLRSNLTFIKKRVSYIFTFTGQEPLRLDADMLYGAKQGKKEQRKKLSVLEIEDTSSHTAREKLTRILSCAAVFDFPVDEKHAAQSTRSFLESKEQI